MRSVLIGDLSYHIDSDDAYLEAVGSVFEKNNVCLFGQLVNKDDIVADIGANIGLTSLLFSQLSDSVDAFEPSKSTFRILQKNLRNAGVRNVRAYNIGLGEKKATLTLTYAKSFRAGAYVSDIHKIDHDHATESISIDTIDNFYKKRDRPPDFIKIDVEGFEANVVKGGGLTLVRGKPVVVMELNHFCLNVFRRTSVPDFIDALKNTFPILYAVDNDNLAIRNMYDQRDAYDVFYSHVVNGRYMTLVGSYSASTVDSLKRLQNVALAEVPGPNTQIVAAPRGRAQFIQTGENLKTNRFYHLFIELFNDSDYVWSSVGDKPVYLSYHWLDAQGNVIVFDGVRSSLIGKKLMPMESAPQKMQILTPPSPGSYILLATVVQESVRWFEDDDFMPARLELVIHQETATVTTAVGES